MPTFKSFDAFGQALGRMDRDVKVAATPLMLEAARRGQVIAEQAASADLGGDPKFSGWAPTLDTRVRPVAPGVVLMTPTRSSAGPWTVAQFGRNQKEGPRLMGPRLTKTGRVSRARQKRWNGRTAPKYTADDAVSRIKGEPPRGVESGFKRIVRRHLDVS